MHIRDSQRSKVYAFDRPYMTDAQKLSLQECYALAGWAYAQYGLTNAPRVTDGRGTNHAFYRRDSNKISLPLWARIPSVVLHESAHGITRGIYDDSIASHGPEFVRVLLELLHRKGVDRLPSMRARAREMNLKVSAETQCLPLTLSEIRSRVGK